jgi:ribosomal protein L11 methyltransferase
MDYIELNLTFPDKNDISDILITRLTVLGFEGFEETGTGLQAYIPADKFDVKAIQQIDLIKRKANQIKFSFKIIMEENWNALWESDYEPVIIPGLCVIRAPFHPRVADVKYDIIIEPKMSFGTAHHDTTFMMISLLFEYPPQGLSIVDMGCGTGILAILASMLGANEVVAIDNDAWAYENAISNVKKNNVSGITVYLGDAGHLKSMHFDRILANINRNTLLQDIPAYSANLNENGLMVVSGFHENDLPLIRNASERQNMVFVKSVCKGEWTAAVFKK